MAKQVRSVEFLPEIFQTPVNKQFLSATLDQLIQEPRFTQTQGFIGRRVGLGVNANDNYVTEPTKIRRDYQLEPGVVQVDPEDTRRIVDAITYPGINDALRLQGAITDNANRLYTSDYYTWDPFVDFDKMINYAQYYWLPSGPLAVDVRSNDISLFDSYDVTRANGSYTFSNLLGTNPTITLVQGGRYTFNVAQNNTETATFRVTNNDRDSWNINYLTNPTLELVRGNTYVFNLSQTQPWAFYIKTQPTQGTTNLYSNGVVNNGASEGLINFKVPMDAPDVLYYANDLVFNLQGQFNIVDPAPNAPGPGFWIQTQPGVNGKIAPNISSRDILGVENNGTDLGQIVFNVPLATDQDFFYNLPTLLDVTTELPLPVDLATDLQFDDINNQFVDQFLLENPNGIDGITNLQGRTLVFLNRDIDPVSGGWQQTTFFDPLLNVGNVISGTGSYDSLSYDETTFITNPETQYGVWRVNYQTAPTGKIYMVLQFVQDVPLDNKFAVGFGADYSNTSWYKGEDGYFEQVPLLTADRTRLFYQDGTDPSMFGQINIIDPQLVTALDVDQIIGKKTYTSPNGVVFTNGLKVIFRGNVIPAGYQGNEYYVEGVGTAIKLLLITDTSRADSPSGDFLTPETYTNDVSDPYDATPYDFANFDGDLNQPVVPDYLTISRASPDLNAWTRSNRWFHIDVIRASATYNNTTLILNDRQRAARPILEYNSGLHLFNSGTQGKEPVNIIDFSQTDAFSVVNGAIGFSTDGYDLVNGSRIIFANDTDPQVRNKIYSVQFVTPDSVAPFISQPIIVLTPAVDGDVLINQMTVSLDGNTQQGISYYYDGVEWIRAQQKISVNQPPLFNLYDKNGVSFGNQDIYPSSNFQGSPLFSYAIGDAEPDLILGFPLTYLSLTNIGDIVFDNNLYKDTFNYTVASVGQTLALSTGFARQYTDRVAFARKTGWENAITTSLVRQQFQFSYTGMPLLLDVAVVSDQTVPPVQMYIRGQFVPADQYRVTIGTDTTTIELLGVYQPNDQIEVSVLSNQISTAGFYEVPINLSNNPLNNNSQQFSLGTIRSHYSSLAENLTALSGPAIGANNVRDLGNVVPYGLQILQQSSPMTLTGYFMRDANYDIFASLAYNSTEYIKFKSQLLNAVTTFSIAQYGNWTTAELLDAAIAQITLGRTDLNSFYWSDMLPTGTVFTSNSYTINPVSENRFNTVQTYNFTQANYHGLSVYVNSVLLTRGRDYVVSTESATLTITGTLTVGDIVTINEYATTAGNFVPNTPTKLGLYPAYVPEIFPDQTAVYPTLVIQGHDGSITTAFGDIRDQVLLEFEQRIYNNLKLDGNPVPLVAEDVLPGYFRTTDYSQEQINQILGEDFLAWAGANKVDYTTQTYIASNPFTYNYSQAGNRLDQAPLLGAWRGIYRYFYDTLTPETTPWEMLGFTVQPDWWASRYGMPPYTSDNLVLWEDLEQGIVADPAGFYVIPKYRRPGLTQVIPVDGQGVMLSPLYSVVGAYNPQAFVKSWQIGDGGPVEASWWQSSSYPFAVMRLLVLTRPAEFFSLFADRDLYRYSEEFDQYLYNERYRIQPQHLEVYGNGISKASYIDWIVDYNRQAGIVNSTELSSDLSNLDVRLCYRTASFVTQQNLSMFLEKGSPGSENTSTQIPAESYDLLLYKNQPFNRVNYSAVIVEVVEDGYSVFGYGRTDPYFRTLQSRVSSITQTITGGLLSATVPSQYTETVVQVPYGYTFTNLAGVVDFLLSYGEYLRSQGLSFTTQENGLVLDWTQMAQEFLYFAAQGWATGTIININPSATQLVAFRPGATVDSIVTYTPENILLDQNRQAFDVKDLIVFRQDNVFQLNPAEDGSQTISYLQLQFTDYEDMVVLANRTIFNDLIYDTVTGERQNRIGLKATVATEWNGTLNAQGFILNQNNVVPWRPNTEYTKGEIVLYKNNFWQAANIVQPSQIFEYVNWYKSNYDLIEQGLLQNLATKADQLSNSYNTQTPNINRDNDLLAYGLIGFKPRQYMTDLNLDDTSQVNIYKEFIKTMGTLRATELFGNASFDKEQGQYQIYENWGVQIGQYGANANRSWFEVVLNEALLTGNPSTVEIVLPGQTSQANQATLLSNLWATSYAIPNTNILPTTFATNLDTALPSAGYVNFDDADITVFNINDPSSIAANLSSIGNGTTIWVAQENNLSWNIYQCAQVPGRLIQLTDNLDGTSVAKFSATVDLAIGDLIIVRYFDTAVDGVYRVLSRPGIDTVVIQYEFLNSNQTTLLGTGIVFYLQTMRVSQPSDIINLPYADQLVPGATAWVDNNGLGLWTVLQKSEPFAASGNIQPDGLQIDSQLGSSVAQSTANFALLTGAPGADSGRGRVYTSSLNPQNQYIPNSVLSLEVANVAGYGNSLDFGDRTWAVAGASASNAESGYAAILYLIPGSNDYLTSQLLSGATESSPPVAGAKFGTSVRISNDERWIYVGAPGENKIYVYTKINEPVETLSYVADGVTFRFPYSDAIEIDENKPGQLEVSINSLVQPFGATPTGTYLLVDGNVQFEFPPNPGDQISIVRRVEVLFDYTVPTVDLQDFLFTATDINSFTVTRFLQAELLRPNIDYTFNLVTKELTFTTTLTIGEAVLVQSSASGAYWKFVDEITMPGNEPGAEFGASIAIDDTGTQILIGAPNATVESHGTPVVDAGAVYAYDRSVEKYIIDNADQHIYTFQGYVPGRPIAVTLNNQQLTNTAQYIDGQFTQIDDAIILSESVVLTVGDTLQIQTNLFKLVQKIIANKGIDKSDYGRSIDVCSNNCSVYVGAPLDTFVTGVTQSGMVERRVNQSRTYGITTSLIANPVLTAGDTIRINNMEVAVPATYVKDGVTVPGNNVAGLAWAINGPTPNIKPNIPNVIASATADAVFLGDGATKIFSIGDMYSSAQSYNTRVLVNDVLQKPPNTIITVDANAITPGLTYTISVVGTTNFTLIGAPSNTVGTVFVADGPTTGTGKVTTKVSDYSYNAATKQIFFTVAPAVDARIVVVSGRLVVSVQNLAAAEEFNRLTVLPGSVGTAFADLGFNTYAYTQSIASPNPTAYAQFGTAVNVNTGAVNLVVGSPNGDVYEPTTFDAGQTFFDDRSTTVFGYTENSGVVFTFDFLPSIGNTLDNPGKFVFGQQVYLDTLTTGARYGQSVSYRSNRLVVGSPGNDLGNNTATGYASVYDNPNDGAAWKPIYTQLPSADVNLLNSVYTYNKLQNSAQTYFDFIDPLQGKILGVAQRNIDYTGTVDPAQYNQGTVHRTGTSWGAAHEGEIWWDTNTVRFIDANQDSIVYASRRWAQTFPGSRVDIYQWISSSVPPLAYTGTGTPLSTTSFSAYSTLDNQGIVITTYYFWVRGIPTVATQYGKTLSTTAIASYIVNPVGSGLPYMAALSANSVALYNAKSVLSADDTVLHVEYDRQALGSSSNIHTEFTFIADGKEEDFLPPNLYRKFLDSMCGVTVTGAVVPDPKLSPGMRYGVQFRPRQSMFIDRYTALQNYLSYVNRILIQYPVAETRTINLLLNSEPLPPNVVTVQSNFINTGSTYTITFVGTTDFTLIGAATNTVGTTFVATGIGTGTGLATTVVWNQNVPNLAVLRFQDLLTVPVGYLYLVDSDEEYGGRWTIYQVVRANALSSPTLQLVRVQSYDTRDFWSYVDWYLPGYNSSIQPMAQVPNAAGLKTLTLEDVPVGGSVEVASNGQGKFEIYRRIPGDWELVGLQDGTIQFSDELWNYAQGGFGFDAQVFDGQFFDQNPSTETREVLRCINEELFIGDLLIHRNRALMLMFQFIYTELSSPDWLIKTSYITVDHKVRGLLPYELFQSDNQDFVLDYLNEVKPYHVQNLEFNLIYDGINSYPGQVTDFDVPARWNDDLTIPRFISPVLTPYTYSNSTIQSFDSDAGPDSQIWLEPPWQEWYSNYLIQVQGALVTAGGSGYTEAPTVEVIGACVTPAVMTAVINSAQQVVAVLVIDAGSGYAEQPLIVITGGNGEGARAIAQMGNDLVRSIKTTIKYDRCEYVSPVAEWQANVVYAEGDLVRWTNRVWSSNATQASSVFTVTDWTFVPAANLNGADRTMGYYQPTADMPGLSLPLLINGASYPGVQVFGLGFENNTGFDVGNFDINPYDNFSIDEVGRPTYDPHLLDARYSSSYLDLFLGTRPTDINVDGGGYIDTFSSYAPEELVPGSEFDTLDFRVFTTPGSDWQGQGHGFPIAQRSYVYDPQNPVLNFSRMLPVAMVVLLFNVTTGELVQPLSYNWADYELTVDPDTASSGDAMLIYATGTGGGNQLLNASYLGSDLIDGSELLIPFPYRMDDPNPSADCIMEFLIYNGQTFLVPGVDYTFDSFGVNKTKITFSQTYDSSDRINLSALGHSAMGGMEYSWSVPVIQQIVVTDPDQLLYPVAANLQNNNAINLIVTVDGIRARPSEGIQYRGNGVTTTYALPDSGNYDQSIIADYEVVVYLDDVLQIQNINYVVDPYDGSTPRTITFISSITVQATAVTIGSTYTISFVGTTDFTLIGAATNTVGTTFVATGRGTGTGLVTVSRPPEAASIINIAVQAEAQYLVFNNNIEFQPTTGLGVGQLIEIITWNDTSEQDILTQVIVGPEAGTNLFFVSTRIYDPSRLLVTLDGKWLFLGTGYEMFYGPDDTFVSTSIRILGPAVDPNAVLSVTSFTFTVVPGPMAFRIFQDMRGVQSTYRITADTTTVTTAPVAITDDIIHVADSSALSLPNLVEDNVWGMCTIGAERIMYRYINEIPDPDHPGQFIPTPNVISGLLRGTAGTAISAHVSGAVVYNLGLENLLPKEYQDYIVSNTTLADGSTTEFTAPDITSDVQDSTLIDEAVEIYVGGIRVTEGFVFVSNNPVVIEFDQAPPAGVNVTILVRRGVTWYQQGVDPVTASNGQALQVTETPAARFLRGLATG